MLPPPYHGSLEQAWQNAYIKFFPQVAPSLEGKTILNIHEITYLTPIIFDKLQKAQLVIRITWLHLNYF